MVKQTHFPKDLLFIAYNFYRYYHNKPVSYAELFEFCKLKELEGLMEEYFKRMSAIK